MYRRIIISVVLSILIIFVSVGIASYISVHKTIKRVLNQRIELAKTIAKHTDTILESNLNRLYDISLSGGVDFSDKNWEPEKKALEIAYQYSIFTDGIFLLDRSGNKILSYPPTLDPSENLLSIPYISTVITEGRPLVSDIFTLLPMKRKVIFALVPLKNASGDIVGIAGGEINPTNYILSQLIKYIPAEKETYIEIVDSHGIVLASNNPHRIFTGSDHNRILANLISGKQAVVRTCHVCHPGIKEGTKEYKPSNDILAFAPLENAHWGVSILQPEEEMFVPAKELYKTFIIFGIGSIGVALLIAVGMSRSIVKPVHELIDATHKIATGDMSKSISFGGVDEIGMLSSSFEVMRVKLADSLESLHQSNVQLEARVAERTRQIAFSQKKVERLLKQLISVQEEERKRIARGLHDETMQSLSALLMKVEICRLHPAHFEPETASAEMKKIVIQTLDGIRDLIQNLRPSILDDLGLEAAIRWLLDKHLGEKDIKYFFSIFGVWDRKTYTYLETALFRLIQEIISNIARHADAENVFVVLRVQQDFVTVDIEDDGRGFEVQSAIKQTEDGRGLGILGMTERINLLDGKLTICSIPGEGTRISFRIPFYTEGDIYE